jgi:hypothetical protein
MPLPLPNLDDHDYADLLEMARSLIPGECPEWTDHNPTDTGIILLELFAWVTDLLLYQSNQVSDQSQEVFLQLLKGDAQWRLGQQSLQSATQETILALRQRYRAVTPLDYEVLVQDNFPVGRVKAFADRDLTLEQPTQPAIGHVSLVVVSSVSDAGLNVGIQQEIWRFLNDRRLLGTKHHVVEPDYVPVTIAAELHLEVGRHSDQVQQACQDQLKRFFDPLSGGDDRQGWKFGRSVYVSEVYQQLDQIEGVDYVEAVRLNDQERSIPLQAHQLVQFSQFSSVE